MQGHQGTVSNLDEIRHLVKLLDQKLGFLTPMGLAQGGPGGQPEAERRLSQVVEFASTVIATLEVEPVVEKALLLLLDVLTADYAAIVWRETPKRVLERMKSVKKNDGNAWAIEKLARAACDRTMDLERGLSVDDAASDPLYGEEVAAYELDLGAFLVVPILDQNRCEGAVFIGRTKSRSPFGQLDRQIAEALVLITSRALSGARTVREQQERRAHLEMLNHLYRAVSGSLELEQVLDQVAQITVEVTKAERTFILLNTNGQLRLCVCRDVNGPLSAQASREISKSVVQKVMTSGQGVFIFDTASDKEFSTQVSVVNLKLNSIVAVPLNGQSGINGILYIDSRSRALDGLEQELELLTAIANVASLAVENARLFRQATVDGLTGLYVRSYFNVRLEEEIKRARRYGRPLSLVVMDIDHFKKFNDTYGHATGDEVIKLVAKALKSAIRTGIDFPARYGGEELVLVLPETAGEGAMVVAERIRTLIEQTGLPGPNGQPLQVTASLGVSVYPQMADNGHALFECADQALYASKHAGRNRTTLYSPPTPAPGAVPQG